MVWERNGTPDTLTGTSNVLTISDLIAAKVNQFLFHGVTKSGSGVNEAWEYNNDSNNVYADRQSFDGATDTTRVNQPDIITDSFGVAESFSINYTVSVSGEEKLCIIPTMNNRVAGAGTAPSRTETVGKYVPSPDVNITQVQYQANDFQTWGTDSNLSALADVVAAPAAVGGWVELGRTILGSGSENITVSSLANKRYYMILSSVVGAASAAFNYAMMGNGTIDTGSNWAYRYSRNGATDTTAGSTTDNYVGNASTTLPTFNVTYIANLSAKEKLIQNQFTGQNTAGAGNAPNRSEQVSKWVNTSNPLDIFALKSLSPNFDTGSEVVVLGWDPADVHTNNFWEEIFSETLTSNLQEFDTGTITAKKYLWLQFYQVGHTGNSILTFNADSGTNYARRHEINGAADATVVSQTGLVNVLTGGTGDTQSFTNMFIINNSANEKLMTFSTTFDNGTGAATAPQKILGVCKWDDTAAQITRIQVEDNTGTGFNAPSFLKIWGSD